MQSLSEAQPWMPSAHSSPGKHSLRQQEEFPKEPWALASHFEISSSELNSFNIPNVIIRNTSYFLRTFDIWLGKWSQNFCPQRKMTTMRYMIWMLDHEDTVLSPSSQCCLGRQAWGTKFWKRYISENMFIKDRLSGKTYQCSLPRRCGSQERRNHSPCNRFPDKCNM